MAKQLYVHWYGKDIPMDFDLTKLEFGQQNFILLIAKRTNELRKIKAKPEDVIEEARLWFFDFLKREGIIFGDKGYRWTPEDAFILAEEVCTYDE